MDLGLRGRRAVVCAASRGLGKASADVTTSEGREAILAACRDPDILVNNAGEPPPGDFRNFGRNDWIKAIDGNMLAPIALIKASVDGMIARKFVVSSTSPPTR